MIERDCCWECGRRETWRSAFRHWFRWTRLGRWLRPYKPGPYEKYFDDKILDQMANCLVLTQFGNLKPLPSNKGAKTIRFTNPKENT